MNENDEFENPHFNYDAIAECSDLLPLTRVLAMRLKAVPFLTLKQFFASLSDKDVQQLNEVVSGYVDGIVSEDEASEVVLLAAMLSKAEACEPDNTEGAYENINKFIIFAMSANLERQNKVIVDWDAASFDEYYDTQPLIYSIE